MLLALCCIPAILVLLVIFLVSTFLQVLVGSAVNRFGCCCADDTPIPAVDGSTTRAPTPPVAGSGGGQQQLQPMRNACARTTEQRRSASGCGPGAVRMWWLVDGGDGASTRLIN